MLLHISRTCSTGSPGTANNGISSLSVRFNWHGTTRDSSSPSTFIWERWGNGAFSACRIGHIYDGCPGVACIEWSKSWSVVLTFCTISYLVLVRVAIIWLSLPQFLLRKIVTLANIASATLLLVFMHISSSSCRIHSMMCLFWVNGTTFQDQIKSLSACGESITMYYGVTWGIINTVGCNADRRK